MIMSRFYFEKNNTVTEELKEFSGKIEGFQTRKIDPDDFKHRRLLQGIYGQRQPALFMVRVKIPAGRMEYDQVIGLSEATREYGRDLMHITTRQDIQVYYVKIKSLDPILQKLSDHGLTTRESSGATIRNIITSPFAGHLRDQVFDIMPAVKATVDFFMRHSETQHLPRKFKISFSENNDDLAASSIHDMGFVAREKEGKPGFKVMFGGALGPIPIEAKLYSEFVPAEELLLHTLAILRAFEKHGDRSKRSEARLKFQINKIGLEKFIGYVHEEVEGLRAENYQFPSFETPKTENAEFDFGNPFDAASEEELHVWYENNVVPSNLKDQYMVLVQVPNGDLSPETFIALADHHKGWHNGSHEFITLTDTQNIVLKGLEVAPADKKARFSEIYGALKELGLGRMGEHVFSDVVTCMGSATCASGITHAPGLSTAVTERFEKAWLEEPRLKGATIHISGCSNSCARHHVSTLGFSGRADTTTFEGDQQAPAYNVFYGGALLPDSKVRIGQKISERILAKRIPDFIEAILEYFRKNASATESFDSFVANLDKEVVAGLVQKFSIEERPVEEKEALTYDWGKDTPYVMEYGEGECS